MCNQCRSANILVPFRGTMKKLLPISLFWFITISLCSAQCDSLLRLWPDSSAILDSLNVCEKNGFVRDFTYMEYRKGGSWYSRELGKFNGNLSPTVLTKSQYFVYTYENAVYQCKAKDSVLVTVNPIPQINLTKPADVCENSDPVKLDFLGSPIGGTWYDSSSVGYVDQGEFYPHKAKASGLVPKAHPLFYIYIDPKTKCGDTLSVNVIVKPLPEIKITNDTILFAIKDSTLDLDTFLAMNKGKGAWIGNGVVEDGGKYYFKNGSVGNIRKIYSLTYFYTEYGTSAPFCTNQTTVALHLVGVPVGNNEDNTPKGVQVYPNPSTGNLRIKGQDKFSFKIFSLNGQMVEMHSEKTTRKDIKLEPGIYWLSIDFENGKRRHQKLIIH